MPDLQTTASAGWERARVLLCAVDPKHQGGVAEYFRALRPHFPPGVEWFVVGSRPGQRWRLISPLRVLWDAARLAWKLRNPAYAVVHLNPSLNAKAVTRDALLLLVAKMLGRSAVVFFHGWDARFHALVRRRFPSAFRLVFSRADALIVLSKEFADALKLLGIGRPVTVETTVVGDDIIAFARQMSPREQADGLRILFLSRVERYKGVYETLEAFRLLRDRYPDVRLCIAGVGLELEGVKRWVASTGTAGVSCVGHLTGEAKISALREADVYILPTYGEGMPISVLEAMVMGLPVVTCRTGGLRDFFEHGTMGVLLEGPSVPALAEALENLRNDPEARRTIGAFNSAYARDRFSPAAAMQRFLALYRGLGWCPTMHDRSRTSGTNNKQRGTNPDSLQDRTLSEKGV